MEKDDILKRVDELIARTGISHDEMAHATNSLLASVYGEQSPQLAAYTKQVARNDSPMAITHYCDGALRNLKREIEGGLTGNVRQQVTGEVLTDLIQLSRLVLTQGGDQAKNVAAVLAAAAFEDAIRRMGKTFAGAIGKDDLADVLAKLKDARKLQGTQVGIAQSYLNFRNSALHANWDRIEKESVHSVLGFVEQLLLKYFS